MLPGMKRFIPIGLILLSAVPMLGGLFRLFSLATGMPLDNQARFAANPIIAAMHIVGATCFATIGALQFSPRKKRWHRLAGRVIAPMGVVGALSGIWMILNWPLKEYDTPTLTWIRVATGVATIVMIVVSTAAVLKRDYAAHGRWMTRAYAIGASGGTQFFTLLPFLTIESIRSELSYGVSMSVAYVINLAVAEWSLRPKSIPRQSSLSRSVA
jgi:uncharacterized membrane protein